MLTSAERDKVRAALMLGEPFELVWRGLGSGNPVQHVRVAGLDVAQLYASPLPNSQRLGSTLLFEPVRGGDWHVNGWRSHILSALGLGHWC
jgi:hypothetical protein